MTNPYEPPQTIDTPPPLAEAVPAKWPRGVQLPQLPRAAAHCAWAGQMLLFAALAAVLLVLGEAFENFFAGLMSAELSKNLQLMSGLSLGLLLVGGWFKNMLGQLLFVQRVQDHAIAAAYRMLFVLGLVKVLVVAAIGLVFFYPTPGRLQYLLLALLIVFAFLQFHTVLMQTQALRRWRVVLARPFARGLLEGYKYLSLAAFVVYASQVTYWFQEHREPLPSLVLGALVLFAGSMAAYSKLYRHLETELKKAGA